MKFEERFEKFITLHRLLAKRQSVLLAVSGGIDSMVMLDLFVRLRRRWNIKLGIIHVNHQLRGTESDADEHFVHAKADLFGVDFHSTSVDVKTYMHDHKLSKQESARVLRYEALENVRLATHADVVATAHHLNDNAETILMNILRGAGVRGLAGIPLCRDQGCIIRPLLFAARDEITKYAEHNNIQFREDSSNALSQYKRNELRNIILPRLQARHKINIAHTLNTVAGYMRTVEGRLNTVLPKLLHAMLKKDGSRWIFSLKRFYAEPVFMQEEILAELLRTFNVETSTKRIDAILHLTTIQSGKMATIDKKIRIYKENDQLMIVQPEPGTLAEIEVMFEKEYTVGSATFAATMVSQRPARFEHDPRIEYIDAAKLGKRLVVRPWKYGDRFMPLGMKFQKKVSDFFSDSKIPRALKPGIPILESDGIIVWICGLRLDDRFKLTEQTDRIVKLAYRPILSNHA